MNLLNVTVLTQILSDTKSYQREEIDECVRYLFVCIYPTGFLPTITTGLMLLREVTTSLPLYYTAVKVLTHFHVCCQTSDTIMYMYP